MSIPLPKDRDVRSPVPDRYLPPRLLEDLYGRDPDLAAREAAAIAAHEAYVHESNVRFSSNMSRRWSDLTEQQREVWRAVGASAVAARQAHELGQKLDVMRRRGLLQPPAVVPLPAGAEVELAHFARQLAPPPRLLVALPVELLGNPIAEHRARWLARLADPRRALLVQVYGAPFPAALRAELERALHRDARHVQVIERRPQQRHVHVTEDTIDAAGFELSTEQLELLAPWQVHEGSAWAPR